MSTYKSTKLLPKGLQVIRGVIAGKKTFDITSASFSSTQTTEQNVMSRGSIPNILGSVPIVSIDDYSMIDQGILGIELSFSQESTKLSQDIDLQSVQIEGRQSGESANYPIAFTLAEKPELLTLSDPSFEFRLMVYVQVGDTDKVTINVNPDGMESRREHKQDFDYIVSALKDGYVDVGLTTVDGKRLSSSNNEEIIARKSIIESDKTLSVPEKAADAQVVGQDIRAIQQEIININRDLRTSLESKDHGEKTRNLALANADGVKKLLGLTQSNLNEINGIKTNATDLENGIISNSRTLNILDHSGNSISAHDNRGITANVQYIVIDPSLTKQNKAADAKAVGDALTSVFNVLNKSILKLTIKLNEVCSLTEDNDTIRNLTNRIIALEAKK